METNWKIAMRKMTVRDLYRAWHQIRRSDCTVSLVIQPLRGDGDTLKPTRIEAHGLGRGHQPERSGGLKPLAVWNLSQPS